MGRFSVMRFIYLGWAHTKSYTTLTFTTRWVFVVDVTRGVKKKKEERRRKNKEEEGRKKKEAGRRKKTEERRKEEERMKNTAEGKEEDE